MTNVESFKDLEEKKDGLDVKLQDLIKEISELSDGDGNNDKIDGVLSENQSNEGLVQKSLNEGLKNSLMKCDKSVVDVLVSELSKFRGKEGVDDLLKLLNEVQQQKFSETLDAENNSDFGKFKGMIEGKNKDGSNTLNELNTLSKNEMEGVITFVKNTNNKSEVFDLYTKMENVNKPENFKRTDRKNFDTVMDAIKDTYPELKEHGMDAVRQFQSEGIKNNNGENGAEENKDEGEKDVEKKEGEGNGGFEKINNIKEGLNIGVINGYIESKIGRDKIILRYGDDGYECNMDNVKEFLGKIVSKEITFDKDFIAVNSATGSRKAWLSAVQILLNKEHNGSLTVDGQYVKNGETYSAVKKFQEEYNKSNMVDGKYPKGFEPLVEDGIPGPKTLAKLLGNSVDESGADNIEEGDDHGNESGENVEKINIDDGAKETLGLVEKTDFLSENKKMLNISENATVYVKEGDIGGLYYKNGDEVVRTSVDEPWIKKSIAINGGIADVSKWPSKVDVFEGGKTKMEELLKSDELKNTIGDDVSITILEGDPKQYMLNNGDEKIVLTSDILTKNFCGQSKIQDKLKLVYLATELKTGKVNIVTRETSGQKYLALSDEKYGVNLSNIDIEEFNDYCENKLDFSITYN